MGWGAKFVPLENEQKILSAWFLGDHITVYILLFLVEIPVLSEVRFHGYCSTSDTERGTGLCFLLHLLIQRGLKIYFLKMADIWVVSL